MMGIMLYSKRWALMKERAKVKKQQQIQAEAEAEAATEAAE